MEKSKFEQREYQDFVINFVKNQFSRQRNVIIELDCGLGKRIIMMRLLTDLLNDKKVLAVLHSSSSLAETVKFFNENTNLDFGWLNSRTNKYFRKKLIESKNVIFTTPQIARNLISQGVSFSDFDVLIINEVDKILKRVSTARSILVQPWNSILEAFKTKRIVGMSGTLRDAHAIQTENNVYMASELLTLKSLINAEIITMDEIMKQSDVEKYINKTKIVIVPVYDKNIVSLIQELDQKISAIFHEMKERGIIKDLGKSHKDIVLPHIGDIQYDMFLRLTLLRKYLIAMTPKKARKMWMMSKNSLQIAELSKIPIVDKAPKIDMLFEIIKEKKSSKVIVLCSYKDMVNEIYLRAKKQGFEAFKLTGEVFDQKEMISNFEKIGENAILIISPVGERDLDFSTVNDMFIVDVINTTKTMYQRIKRIRGGHVYILYYKRTSEERKVKRLLRRIKEKYPWSVEIISY